MKHFFCILLFLTSLGVISFCGTSNLKAQSLNFNTPEVLKEIDHIQLIPPKVEIVRADNELLGKDGTVKKVSKLLYFDASPNTAGSWNQDNTVWKLRVSSDEAKACALHFNKFELPIGSKLYAYDVEGKEIQGPFSSVDNPNKAEFSIGIFQASDIILEYIAPNNSHIAEANMPIIELSSFSYFYEFPDILKEKTRDYGHSGDCEVDVNCPEGNDWQVQKKGVARIYVISGGSGGWCSGTLINNTANDGTPYFLTAFHCMENATAQDFNQWIFYFDFEVQGCNISVPKPSFKKIVGCQQIAHSTDKFSSDLLLVKLNTTAIDIKDKGLIYNGWDISSQASQSGVCIHHPNGDAKKISTYTNPLEITTFKPASMNNHWRVRWAVTQSGHGVVEGGSSGAPLFEGVNGLIVGSLSGGMSSCANPYGFDEFGRMDKHWDLHSEQNMQLKHWLNTNNSSQTFCGVYDPNNAGANMLIVKPTHLNLDFDGIAQNLELISNVEWTISSSQTWLTINPTSGSGNASIVVSADTNPEVDVRTAEITVSYGSGDNATYKTILVSQLPEIHSFSYDFESCENFVVDQFYPCTTYDGDLKYTFGLGLYNQIHYKNKHYKGAFIAFNPSVTQPPQTDANIQAHGGNKFGACFAADGTPKVPNDDWFITPKVSLKDNAKFEFYARTHDAKDGKERFRVLVSTTTNDPASFTKVSPGNYIEVPESWTKYEYDLSAYDNQVVYVAIQCVSFDAYVFMIDDIKLSSENNVPENILFVNPTNIYYDINGGEKSIVVTSNLAWTVSASDNDWLTLSTTEGNENGIINVVAIANEGSVDRTATLTILPVDQSLGVLPKTITVIQYATSMVYALSVNHSSLSFLADGGNKKITVSSNVNWTVTTAEDWLTISPTASSDDGEITVTASPNTSFEERTASVIVAGDNGVASKTITITQAAAINPNPIETITLFSYDFESCPDFVVDDFLPCTTYDGDGKPTYPMNNSFQNQQYVGAFIAFNPSKTSPPLSTQNSVPHGGQKYGACFAVETSPKVANNDWFITPKVSLQNNSKFSFWARSYISTYGLEKFNVLISTSDNEIASFTSISGSSPIEAPASWLKYEYDLSNYNGQDVFLAIQCVSEDVFIFMIDDIEIISEVNNEPPLLSVNTKELLFGEGSESKEISITSNVNWSISCIKDWVTITPPTGNTNKSVNILVSANSGAVEREAVLTVSGENVYEEIIINLKQSASTSILENENFSKLNIYPNPSLEYFDISSGFIMTKVQVISLLGELLVDEQINSNMARISVSELVSAQYLVRIFAENGEIIYRRISKE